jgi:hypothetical protein
MRRQDEAERHARARARQLVVGDAGLAKARVRLGERLARQTLLVLVLPAPPDAVVLLGDVRELEVEPERAQHERLPLGRQRAHAVGERAPVLVVPGPARLA